MIAVCIASRGLIHSRTMQDILANVLGEDELGFYFAHGHPIPEAQNIIVEEALDDKPDYIWMVEDDMCLPYNILDKLFKANADIATADYPVRQNQHVVTYLGGKLAYAGLGCTLIDASVFDKLEKPYFRVDTEYQIQDDKLIKAQRVSSNYGIFDVAFYQKVLELGFRVEVIDMTAGQYFLKKPELPKWHNQTALDYEVEEWHL